MTSCLESWRNVAGLERPAGLSSRRVDMTPRVCAPRSGWGKLAPSPGVPPHVRKWRLGPGWLVFGALAVATLPARAGDCEDEPRASRRHFGTSLFDRVDANRDGRVSAEESRQASARHFARLDENADGVLTWKEASRGALSWRKARFDDRFDELDRNGDDRVDRHELQLVAYRFAELDGDGDGFLSRVELASRLLRSRNARARRARARATFRRADGNADGRVTTREAALEARRRFLASDRDGDGFVSAVEARLSRRRRR